MNYQIKGQYNYHLEIACQQLNETTNIIVNAFGSKINRIPLGCKFQWFKLSETERIKIENQGNIYQCSVFDIGYRIEAIVIPQENGIEGQAIIDFQKIQISSQLEQKLSQLFHNNMKQQIQVNDQWWMFNLDSIENTSTKQKINYENQFLLPQQNQLNIQFDNEILNFKCKEDKDSFGAFFISIQSLKRVHLKFIAYNIGKMNQKQVNFAQLLNSQLLQLINEKSLLNYKRVDILQPSMGVSQNLVQTQDLRNISQSSAQVELLKREIQGLTSENKRMSLQIEQLIKENNQLEKKSNSKDQIIGLDKLIQSLKAEIYQFQQREEDLKNQNAKLAQALNEKNEKPLNQSSFWDDLKFDQHQDLLQQEKQENVKLRSENLKLMEELTKQKKFGSSSRISEQDKDKLLQINQQLTKELSEQTRQLQDLQIEIEMYKNMSRLNMSMSIQQLDDPLLTQKIHQLELENQTLKKKIEIYQQSDEEVQKQKRQFRQQQKTLQEKELQIKNLQETNKRYLEENLSQFEEIRQLRDKFDFPSQLNQSINESRIQENLLNQKLKSDLERIQQDCISQISKLKKKIEKLTLDLQETNQQKNQLIQQNEHLAEELAKANSKSILNQSDILSSRVIYESDHYKDLCDQNNIQKRKIQDISQKLENTQKKEFELNEKLKQYESQNQRLKLQLQDVQLNDINNNEIRILQNQIEAFKNDKDNLKSENIQLQDEIQQLKLKYKQLQDQFYEIKEKSLKYEEEIRTLKKFPQNQENQFNQQLQLLQQQNKNLTEEILRLESQKLNNLSQSNISLSESILGSRICEAREFKELENKYEQSQQQIQELKTTIEQKEREIFQYSLQIKQIESLKVQNEQFVINKNELNQNNQQMQQELREITQQLQNKDKFLLEQKTLYQILQQQLNKEKEINLLQQNKQNELNQQLLQKEQEIRNLQQKYSSTETNINKQNQQINIMQQQLSEYNIIKNQQIKANEDIQILNNKNNQISQENIYLKEHLSDLNQQLQLFEKQILNLNKPQQISNIQQQEFQINSKQFEQKIDSMNKQIVQLQDQLLSEKKQNSELVMLLHKLNEDLREQQERSFSIDRSSETYLINRSFTSDFALQYQSNDMGQIDKKRQSTQDKDLLLESINETKIIKQEAELLKTEINSLVQNNKELVQQLERYKSDYSNLLKKVQEQQLQGSGNKNELQNKINQLEEQLLLKEGIEQSNIRLNNAIKQQITKQIELSQELTQVQQINQDLNEQIIFLQKQQQQQQFTDGQDSIQILLQENIKLKQDNDILTLELQKVTQTLTVKDSQINQNNRKNKRLEEQIQTLQQQLQGTIIIKNQDEQKSELLDELQQQRNQNIILTQQLSTFKQFDLQIQTKLNELEEQIERLTRSNNALIEENCRLNDQIREAANMSYMSSTSNDTLQN